MSVGEAFTPLQRSEIEKAIADAERLSGGRHFSVHVGASKGEPRSYAERLHAALPKPANSVLVHVDPTTRSLEIVTGSDVKRWLTNRKAALAALTMQTAFATGDLTRGIKAGLHQLAPLAKADEARHTNTP